MVILAVDTVAAAFLGGVLGYLSLVARLSAVSPVRLRVPPVRAASKRQLRRWWRGFVEDVRGDWDSAASGDIDWRDVATGVLEVVFIYGIALRLFAWILTVGILEEAGYTPRLPPRDGPVRWTPGIGLPVDVEWSADADLLYRGVAFVVGSVFLVSVAGSMPVTSSPVAIAVVGLNFGYPVLDPGLWLVTRVTTPRSSEVVNHA